MENDAPHEHPGGAAKQDLRLRNVALNFPFSSLAIKGRDAQGNIVTKHAVEKILRRMEARPGDPSK